MPSDQPRTAYVLKVYPRFSETFIVTEILAREAAGEALSIYALRPTTDSRFHPQLAQVQAPVTHVGRPHKLSAEWDVFARAQRELPGFGERLGALMPLLVRLDPSDIGQAVDLAMRLRRDGIEKVHVHFANLASWCTAIAAALIDIPFSVTTHAKDLFHDDVDRVVLREVLSRAATVVTISDFNRRFLLTEIDPALEPKVALVRNGLELSRFTYRDPEIPNTEFPNTESPSTELPGAALRVLAVGRLVEKKGFSYLIDAVAALRAEGLDCQVRIVGDGDQGTALTTQVVAAGLQDSVALLGSRSQAELVAELAWADVMVAPCVVGEDGNADGLPTVLLEAMASGVPCIATDVTGIPEAIHPATEQDPATGILLPRERSGLVAEVAGALRVVADPQWPRVAIARAARLVVERDFDTTTQAALLADITHTTTTTTTTAGALV